MIKKKEKDKTVTNKGQRKKGIKWVENERKKY